MKTAYLGLGSNIGDKVGYIQQAHRMLKNTDCILVENCSSLYETEPYGNKSQDWFVNAVVELKTTLSPEKLFIACQRIEAQLGRIRCDNMPEWGPRTIDIDILFYGDEVISTNVLQIPHIDFHSRAFAIVPMLEIAPDFIHPTIGTTITEIHEGLDAPEEVYLYGTRLNDI